MRIAVLTQFVHEVGGVESYLKCVLPAIANRGHDVRVWHEFAPPPGYEAELAIPYRTMTANRPAATLAEWEQWKPDLIFLNGLSKPSLEWQLTDGRPTVTFLHGYQGTCISGTKTRMLPAPSPCGQRLGPSCLLQYYPRRCGGLNPLVMIDGYREQRLRRQLLGRSAFVATFSAHMRREAIAHDVQQERAIHLPWFSPNGHAPQSPRAAKDPWHVAFVGRMERLKGAHMLLDAIEHLDGTLRRAVKITLAGDGRERTQLEKAAARLEGVDISFAGWLDTRGREALFSSLDLLVVPSVWPEPLGLVGIEAASFGVPSVAFDVGGISDWLEDGVTGFLVRGAPSSASLARGIERALADGERLRALGARACDRARQRTLAAHVDVLDSVFRRAISEYHSPCPSS